MSPAYDIDYLLEEVITLPSLPTSVNHITNLINDPDVPLTEVGRAISADPAIALKTLRLVNSAYYGLREKVSSVEHAVVLLGKKVVKNLVFTAAVFDTLQSGDEKIMTHSICTGMAMRSLAESGAAKKVRFDETEEAFAYGLLHDVGKIIVQQHLPKEFAQVCAMTRDQKATWSEAEREVIGADHAEIGSRLAINWKLTPEVINAIAGHHNLDECLDANHRGLAAMVAIADRIAYASGYHMENVGAPEIGADVWEASGVTSADVPAVMEKFFASIDDIEELIDLATE